VHADVTLTRSKVKVKVMGLLNFQKLAKPCMLAAMTVSPLCGFLIFNKNSSGDEIANVNFYAVRPETNRIR